MRARRPRAEQYVRQHALHDVAGLGTQAAALRGRWVVGLNSQAQQRGDVVGQHLGGNVDRQRVLAQARDGLQVQPMLSAA